MQPPRTHEGLQDELTALIKVVTVYPDESLCALEEWAYDAHLQKVIGPEGIPIPPGEPIELAKFAPVVVDQPVAEVPREEKEAKDQVDRWLQRAARAPEAKQRFLYKQALLRAQDFLKSYPNGFFAGELLFRKGTVEFELEQYAQAIRTFEAFQDEFPFHPSGRAADDWIRRAQKAA